MGTGSGAWKSDRPNRRESLASKERLSRRVIVAPCLWRDYGPAVPRTSHQALGDYGEVVVARLPCPKCKRERTLRRLPVNFRCADVICDFCGYLAQVKATERADVDTLPRSLMGAAWGRKTSAWRRVSTSRCSSWSPTLTGQPAPSTTCPPTSSSRRCSSSVNHLVQQRAGQDGSAIVCGWTYQGVTSQYG